MNVDLLLKVKERVLKEKRPVIMAAWFAVRSADARKNWGVSRDVNGWSRLDSFDGMKQLPSKTGTGEYGCGTAGCIAGHALMEVYGGKTFRQLKRKYPEDLEYDRSTRTWGVNFSEIAADILELDTDEAALLFITVHWPQQFYEPYNICMNKKEYKAANKVVADRIDFFIENGF